MAHRVFAYGSNMNLADLVRWARLKGRPPPVIHAMYQAELRGMARCWNYWSTARNGGAANVCPDQESSVWGLILEVDEPTFLTMDLKEGHPNRYSRGTTQHRCWTPKADRYEEAWVYVVTPEFRVDGTVRPTAAYLKLVIDAAVEHQLPPHEIEQLRQTSVAPN